MKRPDEPRQKAQVLLFPPLRSGRPSAPGRTPQDPTPRARKPPVRLSVVAPPPPWVAPPAESAHAGADDHLRAALEQLQRAFQTPTVSAQGDGLLLAIEHASRALGALFDAETARVHLARIIGRL